MVSYHNYVNCTLVKQPGLQGPIPGGNVSEITRKVHETSRRTYAEDLLAVIHEQFEVYANVVSYAKPRVQLRCVSYSSLYANSRVFYAIREATYMYVRT